ncbi:MULTISPECIES: CaiB/BaiF CoA transferase family protein [Mycobacterium]|uniref:CoA-transferase III family protein n=1 Tax=Mycobacterium intracellulare 1956 TaxID=1299331 RepID=X8CQX4_MYCIT|nr:MULTISPECIES: CoA transferase [Mycobacterium]EUA58439.1 coA-transferase III family protein [Mycobacterium intracellulare 1956]ASW84915.1 CoA transferase [Mycobacterium intracellulare]EUA26454.1 coA-transferase III family protein [Mycobacterium intracellulare]MCA2255201.1 CoA transferase [Mycobacterium intracellulare]MCA2306580.1 CoA transferase [Mycobacterium intracellulare]
MDGVRVLEVAQFTFVPAAGAVLADWGADVIKVEHAEKGDAQRGLSALMGMPVGSGSFAPLMEHPNRGKRSLGLALEQPGALGVLHELIRTSDVFLTNFLPAARRRLGIELDDVRKINPDIVYVRGSGFGNSGPDSEKGGYDSTAFWARAGSAVGTTPVDYDGLCKMPAGAYGDSLGGMTIAGGIAAALFARQRTGETSVIDVSLLGVGAWANALPVGFALLEGGPPAPRAPGNSAPTNPLVGNYRTADDRWLVLAMLQPGRYWPEFCRHIDREDLITDPRFSTAEALMANATTAAEIVQEVLAERPLAEWVTRFAGMEGQWAIAQDPWEVGQDPALRANGLIAEVLDSDGTPRELVANPVQFDEKPVQLTRAPQFAEHTDDILRALGKSDDELIDLKISGAVT